MEQVAEAYVRLVLALGRHDPHYVDAYYGPAEWRRQADDADWPLTEIQERAERARQELAEPKDARSICLGKQLGALVARVEMLRCRHFSFDEESAALYDVVDSGRPEGYYRQAASELDSLLPEGGTLAERYERFREKLHIPADRLAPVFEAAIAKARQISKAHIELPENEDFQMEFVRDQVWGAYNWYKGNAQSLIQVNTDLPISVAGVLHLACHEGYPGHHVYNALLETHLTKGHGWVEFSVYPLFSPMSLIAEGTAEYGDELACPEDERVAFEKETLYPLAGIDPGLAEPASKIRRAVAKLNWSSTDSARNYLDGHWTRQETIDWLIEYAVATPRRAEQRLRFIEANRSYVVTYDLGHELVKRYVESRAEAVTDRWSVFRELMSSPAVPSMLTTP
jgi:hypothetical protein